MLILFKMPSTEAINKFVEGYAQLFKNGQRSPILRRPDQCDMKYEDIFFPSLDGTILAGWFIPAGTSQKLIIANHPITCNRYGYPGHLEEYGDFNKMAKECQQAKRLISGQLHPVSGKLNQVILAKYQLQHLENMPKIDNNVDMYDTSEEDIVRHTDKRFFGAPLTHNS